VPLGYQSEQVVTMDVTLNVARYAKDSRNLFFERLLERIRAIPGTTASTMTSAAPPSGNTLIGFCCPVDRKPLPLVPKGRGIFGVKDAPFIRLREVTPGYFQIFGIPILRGRAFAEADRTAQPIVILSESAAKILFPRQDPIGHTVRLQTGNEWAEVVGV